MNSSALRFTKGCDNRRDPVMVENSERAGKAIREAAARDYAIRCARLEIYRELGSDKEGKRR